MIGIMVLTGSVLMALPAEHASADGPGGQIVVTPGDQTGVFGSPSIGAGASSSGSPGLSGHAAGASSGPATAPQEPGVGFPCMYDAAGGMAAYYEACGRPHGAQDAPQPTPGQLAAQAYQLLVLPRPAPHFSPNVRAHSGQATIVGEHTWLWTAKNVWAPQAKRVQAGAVWAEVTATPTTLVFAPGSGRLLSCAGPGTEYIATAGLHAASPDCDYVFDQPRDHVNAVFAIQWTVRWTGSTGAAPAGGTLPDMTSRTAVGFAVAEVQSLNVS
ncbi:hypothetical protein [Kutzneria sp. 744]|uniref:hypothetical protein n=1 Tax=Kutzneria sp. (strain 744) TaxID=345341 RepID=UPI0003EED06B|nr:hypothetical protein [Kutzneria sp. 744]EWM15268.1 ATP/GTP-binding protein [Kutzneria sp. 744]